MTAPSGWTRPVSHIVLPVTHTGMLFSDAVARAVAEFLRDGRFGR